MEKPTRTYVPVAILVVVQFVWWFANMTIPMGTAVATELRAWAPTVWLLTGGFFFGLVAEDINNPRSWIRNNWRRWRRSFELIWVQAVHGINPERVEIVCKIRLLRSITGELLIVRVVQPLPSRPAIEHIILKKKMDSGARGDEMILKLGTVAITNAGDRQANHSIWGEDAITATLAPGQFTIVTDSRNIIQIELGPQIYRIYAHRLADPAQHKGSGKVYLLSEEEFPDLQP